VGGLAAVWWSFVDGFGVGVRIAVAGVDEAKIKFRRPMAC
jgi:hypothetical protein